MCIEVFLLFTGSLKGTVHWVAVKTMSAYCITGLTGMWSESWSELVLCAVGITAAVSAIVHFFPEKWDTDTLLKQVF